MHMDAELSFFVIGGVPQASSASADDACGVEVPLLLEGIQECNQLGLLFVSEVHLETLVVKVYHLV